jgi:hypothetical protein
MISNGWVARSQQRMAPQVGLEPALKHQPKDLASTAGKSKSL